VTASVTLPAAVDAPPLPLLQKLEVLLNLLNTEKPQVSEATLLLSPPPPSLSLLLSCAAGARSELTRARSLAAAAASCAVLVVAAAVVVVVVVVSEAIEQVQSNELLSHYVSLRSDALH
jgi:hypothetical protein